MVDQKSKERMRRWLKVWESTKTKAKGEKGDMALLIGSSSSSTSSLPSSISRWPVNKRCLRLNISPAYKWILQDGNQLPGMASQIYNMATFVTDIISLVPILIAASWVWDLASFVQYTASRVSSMASHVSNAAYFQIPITRDSFLSPRCNLLNTSTWLPQSLIWSTNSLTE